VTRNRPNEGLLSYRHGTLTAMDDVVYMVRCGTREACQRELDRLCALLGAVATNRPTDVVGRGWTARAVLEAEPAPVPE
jgi:hypothetical protein